MLRDEGWQQRRARSQAHRCVQMGTGGELRRDCWEGEYVQGLGAQGEEQKQRQGVEDQEPSEVHKTPRVL